MRGRTTEERILNVLKTEPQRGMALLMEQYTGIVWKIISQYLENPEDIKECVNETFVRFYFQRGKYDPGRASLPFYLSVIARSTAVSRYRKDSRHRTEALKEEEAADRRSGMDACSDRRISGAEARADLERAMKTLWPDEVQIIRMKYYGGMTIQEIADSLHLPYETVKKRHSRSIHKMRRSLLLTLIILILLLLTACTYNVLRYYEIVPDLPEIWRYLTGDGEDGEDITGTTGLQESCPDFRKIMEEKMRRTDYRKTGLWILSAPLRQEVKKKGKEHMKCPTSAGWKTMAWCWMRMQRSILLRSLCQGKIHIQRRRLPALFMTEPI